MGKIIAGKQIRSQRYYVLPALLGNVLFDFERGRYSTEKSVLITSLAVLRTTLFTLQFEGNWRY